MLGRTRGWCRGRGRGEGGGGVDSTLPMVLKVSGAVRSFLVKFFICYLCVYGNVIIHAGELQF